jgi:thymidylate synthase (FAD)
VRVKLLYSTNIESIKKSGFDFNEYELNKHINYTFFIQGISRALLQELVRHKDNISLSVKSTRYTLKELKSEDDFSYDELQRASKYIVLTDEKSVDESSIDALNRLKKIIQSGVSNDRAKYALPESYKTELTWTVNKESLLHFIALRESKAALWEIQELAKLLKESL